MGRRSDPLEDFEGPVHLERLVLVDGDYDEGGAYWGGGGQPVFCAWDDEGHVAYFRARDGNEARRLLPHGTSLAPSRVEKRVVAAGEAEILSGMARGPWASHWAQEEEERGESHGGEDIYETAPPAPKWVKKWAAALGKSISSLNHDVGLEDLYQAARADGFTKDRETFGFYLGMQSVGHGVSWDDDHSSSITIKVPSMELYEAARPDLRFMK
jgi:hypothetical protein